MRTRTKLLSIGFAVLALAACNKGGDKAAAAEKADEDPRPAGPASITIPAIAISTEAAAIQKGQELFASKGCQACHKVGGGKLVGPDLQGVTSRRNPKWIAKMILKPEVMLQEDATAKELFKTHLTPMPNQNVDPATELPALLAFLKSHETN
jgi:mono/diheme cytochrome c family protein